MIPESDNEKIYKRIVQKNHQISQLSNRLKKTINSYPIDVKKAMKLLRKIEKLNFQIHALNEFFDPEQKLQYQLLKPSEN